MIVALGIPRGRAGYGVCGLRPAAPDFRLEMVYLQQHLSCIYVVGSVATQPDPDAPDRTMARSERRDCHQVRSEVRRLPTSD